MFSSTNVALGEHHPRLRWNFAANFPLMNGSIKSVIPKLIRDSPRVEAISELYSNIKAPPLGITSVSYAKGWTAKDEQGKERLVTGDHTIMGLSDAECIGEIPWHELRLKYEPPMWRRSLFIALVGLLVTIAIFIAGHLSKRAEFPMIGNYNDAIFPIIGNGWPARSARGFVARSATTTFVCCLAFIVVSLAGGRIGAARSTRDFI